MYDVKLTTNGDRAEAGTLGDALFAAKTLCDEAASGYGVSRIHRAGVIVARDGMYDGVATSMAREGALA